MGGQQSTVTRRESRYSTWNAPRLQQYSGIDSARLPQLQQEFSRAAGPDGLINRQEFARLYREQRLGSEDPASIERAFRTFDRDGSGSLSFDEFLSAAVMLNKNVNARDRVTYLIDSNNPLGTDNTSITPDYGRNIVGNLNRFYGTNANFDDLWSHFNAANGQVRREEFVSYISSSPTFGQYF